MFILLRADGCGDNRRERYSEVSRRVQEAVLHAAASAHERAATDAEMPTTE